MSESFTDADVALVRDAWRTAPCPRCQRTTACRCVLGDTELQDYRACAVLAALTAARRLLPEGAETEWSWTCGRHDGKCEHEMPDERRARLRAAADGGTVFVRQVGPWLPVLPEKTDQERSEDGR